MNTGSQKALPRGQCFSLFTFHFKLGAMLPKRQRLTTAEFNQFFKSGRRFHHPLMQLIYTPHPTFHGSVVVGKKVAKKAVARNRARRQLYAVLYRFAKDHVPTGVYLVILKPAAASATVTERKAALSEILAQITAE